MRIVALYHPKSDHGGIVEDYARDYHRTRPDKEIELLSLETKQGDAMARLYDVTSYPAILVATADGKLSHFWQDGAMPSMSDLDAYSQGQL